MMDKRVVLLTNFIPPYRLPLFRALSEMIDDFQIFVSSASEPNRAWPVEWAGLSVLPQRNITLKQAWKHPHGFTDQTYIHFPYDTIWLLLRHRPGVVISAEFGIRTLQSVIYRCLIPTSKLIIWATLSEYSERGRGKLRELLRKLCLAKADAVIVNGESGARYIRRFGVRDETIFRVPYTTDLVPFLNGKIIKTIDENLRLLYVGQLIERKGLKLFMEMLYRWVAEHPERSIELIIVGEGPLWIPLKSLPPPTNLKVSFLGFVDYDNLPEIFCQADIFVFPTLVDEWGLVVNEAMAAGLPILGSAYSQAVEELVEDGKTGWVFYPDKTNDVLRSFGRALMSSPKILHEMGEAARKRVLRLTPEFLAKRLAEVINLVE